MSCVECKHSKTAAAIRAEMQRVGEQAYRAPENQLYCCRYPPHVQAITNAKGELVGGWTQWPAVFPMQSCGEFTCKFNDA